ncbi:MAG: hypothetical protein ACPHCI_08475 [Solirubrobacterales bacterium]
MTTEKTLFAREYGKPMLETHRETTQRLGAFASWYFDNAGPSGRPVGFRVDSWNTIDPHKHDSKELWNGPKFFAPTVGVMPGTAAEIVAAASELFMGRPTVHDPEVSVGYDEEASVIRPHDARVACTSVENGSFEHQLGCAWDLMIAKRFDDAIERIEYVLEDHGESIWALAYLAKAYRACRYPDVKVFGARYRAIRKMDGWRPPRPDRMAAFIKFLDAPLPDFSCHASSRAATARKVTGMKADLDSECR